MRNASAGLGAKLWMVAACLALASAADAQEMDWKEHPHHLSVILAGTYDTEDYAPTVGLDYEYRLGERLGVGLVIEHAFDEIDATTLLGVLDLHLWRGLAIQTGPGVEILDEDGGSGTEEEFTYRIGLLYEFEIGRRMTFSPQLHYDITTGENSLIFGGAIGFAF